MKQQISGQRAWRRSLRTVRVPNPAAGADWSYTIPGSELWELLSIYATLTTSAAVANRAPSLIVGDGNVTIMRMPAVQAQAASLVGVTSWGPWGQSASLGLLNRGILPVKYLEAGETIGSQTDLIDVGDQWSSVSIRALVTTWRDGPVDFDDVVPGPADSDA